jgi:predicted CoA-binding protein
MTTQPAAVADFLAARRIVVAGVSRSGQAPANAIFRRPREAGHDAVPVNPNAAEVEGMPCFASVAAVPGEVDALMVVTHPDVASAVVGEALARGVRRIWFHRSVGDGSVSAEAVAACRDAGVSPIVGGCPLMDVAPIDPFHRAMRACLGLVGRVPT